MNRTPYIRLPLLLCLLLLAFPLVAQEGAEEPAEPASGVIDGNAEGAAADPEAGDFETFIDVVDVRVVNVDVYVTDKKGNRVTGLTRDDFELIEDRRPVEITNFYAVEDDVPVDRVASTAITDLDTPDAAPPTPIERAPVPADQRLFLIVYIDNFNIHPIHRNRVVGELGYFLTKELDSEDQVMLVTYDRSLNVRRPFTADPALVARSLDEVVRLTGHQATRLDERRQALERIADSRSEAQAVAQARLYAESVENDLRFSLGALKEMVGYLAGLPGRKAVLYVSDGIPMVPGQDVFQSIAGKYGATSGLMDSFHYDASREFDQLANLANANRVTFYTIDAAGLRLASTFAAENSNPTAGLQVDSAYNSNMQSPLRFLADTTGGTAVINTNRILGRMEQIADDFDTYYSLGYSPQRAGTGRYHRIQVKVKGRRDLVVRHREGYRDKTVEAQMVDTTISSLQFGFVDNPLDVKVGFGDANKRDGRYYVVPVEVDIPLGEVVLVPRAGSHEGRVRLFIAARDQDGDSSPVQQVPVQISIPDDDVERAKEQSYRYTVPLLMRSGPHQVAVGVRDEVAAKESYVVSTVDVGPPAGAARRGGR